MLASSTALAHPDLDEAVQHYERAEFEAARAALARAASEGPLDREELSVWLSTAALVCYAVRDIDAMDRALAQLASIEPTFEWGPATAPDVLTAFERATAASRELLAIDVQVGPTDDTVELAATVTGDPGELVESIALAARTGGEWRRTTERSLVVPRESDRLEYYAAALGPGGAELAREGSAEAPSTLELPSVATRRERPEQRDAPEPARAPHTDTGTGGASPWPWIGLGVGIAAALGVVLGLVIFSGDSRLVGPQVDWMSDG
jgi:hypothetical protein